MAGTAKVPNPAKSSTAQPNGQQANGSGPKVVGPNIKGNREEYQLVMHLQSALFGGVYEAKGRSSGRDFAIKVLHKTELQKAQETSSIEFCEVPLSEIKFADVMRGHAHVMEAEEHFEDMYCHYCVFELCRGGDLLEALKQKPTGFDELQAQFLIRQAVEGLIFLHEKGVAMQDVSLENLLLHVNEKTGHWQVKICDPGQAVHFQSDQNGQEIPVAFRGLVGKSFRPPELHKQESYCATKVDSWCLGWSTFYLLTAQPLFMSADPAQKDADWLLFQNGQFDKLFQTKEPVCSPAGIDFIFRLLQLEPSKRMSIADARNHAWLADPKVPPVMAPKELLPEALRRALALPEAAGRDAGEARNSQARISTASRPAPDQISQTAPQMAQLMVANTFATAEPQIQGGSVSLAHAMKPATIMGPSTLPMRDLPTWASAPPNFMARGAVAGAPLGHPRTPLMRVRSPMRSPRQSLATAPVQALSIDRRSQRQRPHPGSAARTSYVVATAHSPAPAIAPALQTQMADFRGRAVSPLQSSQPSSILAPGTILASQFQKQQQERLEAQSYHSQDQSRANFLATPRSSSRPRVAASAAGTVPAPLQPNQVMDASRDGSERGRAWAFGSRGEGPQARGGTSIWAGELQPRMGSHQTSEIQGPVRAASPPPQYQATAMGTFSPVSDYSFAGTAQGRRVQSPPRAVYVSRSPSPVQAIRAHSPGGCGMGFSWTPAAMSPRIGYVAGGTAALRTASPGMMQQLGAPSYVWSPDASPRAFSPPPPTTISFAQAPSLLSQTKRPSHVLR
ncbi:unnamed protein product [Polarella glacialis]|uniref:Protein kinase domain-containing protein n=2 Tax=Polarella glacialis TaxID=89957 RepID=A0A813FHP9_POLGL|nr:unnamed protein product [Polarella glacialis]